MKLTNEMEPNLPQVKLQVLIYPFLQALDFNLPSHREFSGRSSVCHLTREILADTAIMYGFKDHGSLEDVCKNKHVSVEMKKKYESFVNVGLLDKKMQVRGGLQKNHEEPNETLSSLVHNNLVDPYAWPLMATDNMLKKLSRTYVIVMEIDPLRDDGLIFFERLRRIKVDSQLRYWQGLEHDLFNLFHYNSHSVAVDDLSDYLRRNL